jgi:hypothetical protein
MAAIRNPARGLSHPPAAVRYDQPMRARWIAAIAGCALGLGGCFGYNPSAKRWAYVGDTVLMLGGGGAIAADVLTREPVAMPCPNNSCPYDPPFGGAMVAGAVLVTAGLVGLVINATRPNVKTSR